MAFFSIVVFFAFCYGLGFTISSFVKNSENFLERNLMRIGFGLALVPLLALALNMVKLPGDWRIILVLSLAYPAYSLFRSLKNHDLSGLTNIKITKTDLSILVMLLIFAANLYIYLSGSFAYPYLEDDDPWSHAFGVKFYSIEKNAFAEDAEKIRYMNPYPPAYDIFMGIMHQTNDSVYFTLKFFNALIISLGTIFFYFFVKEFTGNRNKALFAAFALMSIPAFMSHFIWSISITVPLYFVAFYSVERIKHDRKWWIVAGAAAAAALISSPTHSAYFGILFALYAAAKFAFSKKFPLWEAAAGLLGIILSSILWWIPMLIRHGLKGTISGFGYRFQYGTAGLGGTGDRIYGFKDFFFAKTQNMLINNPNGIGPLLFLLAFAAVLFLIFKSWKRLQDRPLLPLASFAAAFLLAAVFLWKTYAGRLWSSLDTFGAQEPISFLAFFSGQSFVVITIAFLLLALSLLLFSSYRGQNPDDTYLGIAAIWLLASFYAVNAAPYIFKLSPFRAWMVMAIPACILAAEGAYGISSAIKKSMGKIPLYLFIALLVAGIYFTSTQQKIDINTKTWPPGGFWKSGEELGAYVWMKDNLPKNSNVFTFWNNAPVIGMDMNTCHWCGGVQDYMKTGLNQSAAENHEWLMKNDYDYIIIDSQTADGLGQEKINAKAREMAESGLFEVAFQNPGAIIFKV